MPSSDSHILVVDDNRTNRLILGRGLAAQGYRITEAESGQQALDLLGPTLNDEEGDTFSLLLLDIMMPGIDGFVKQADDVVRGLMKSSKDTRLDLKSQDAHPVIRSAVGMMEREFKLGGIEFATSFQDDLPPALLAETELTQLLVSIFLNAVQAMPDGGTLEVRTSLREAESIPPDEGSRTGNRVRNGDKVIAIEILDSGPGLPEGQLLQAFDAFFTTKPTDVATGMGLTVARKLIDLHGGVLELTNRSDQSGLCVTILLRKANAFATMV